MSDENKFPYVEGAVVIAKARVHRRAEEPNYQGKPGEVKSEELDLGFVYEQNGPNKKWSEATPSGGVKIKIDQKGALGAMKLGQHYLVAFIPCDPDA